MADAAVELKVVETEVVEDAEDDELLKEYGEGGLEVDHDPAPASTNNYARGPKKPLPRSKHRPGDDMFKGGTFINTKLMMVLFVMFMLSGIILISFKEDLFFNEEENTNIESDDIKINGLKETLKYNVNKISQLTMTLEDKQTELARLKALLKKKKG